ncbi:hypothetical protein HELRODRAFT_100634 [Helobdella robusta]|uniref:Innexin n=1 Tax=Helobdella robusta TaxID=6412 RepID=T1ED09_HELRO|nr:hypothetical protein HELRODRAFT_100634 [Helobdella robusta]ESO01359.1 hypothetical protein HELRODRAFT_100634 [Helobdella robusta]
MDAILDFFGMSKLITSRRGDDDRVDRLNRNVTVVMLIFFAIIVTTKTFVGDPIYCFSPGEFDSTQPDYANSYCWIRNTYSFSNDHQNKDFDKIKDQNRVTYYQWVPLILLVQAFFFYVPHVLWKNCSGKSGLDLNSIVVAGESFLATETAEVRDKTVSYMISQMDRYLAEAKKNYYHEPTISFKQLFACCSCFHGCYLFSFYLFVKFLFLLNAICQFICLNLLFGSDYYSFGVEIIKTSMNDQYGAVGSRQFPRMTMCDLKIRRVVNIHDYKIQCVLPINHFNEKIFLMLWFWFLIMILVTALSLLSWLKRMYPRSKLFTYTYRHLKYAAVASNDQGLDDDTDDDNESDDDDDDDEGTFRKQVKQFVDYLNRDGVFVVKLLAINADTITASDFVYALFTNFRNKNVIKTANKKSERAELHGTSRKRHLCCTSGEREEEDEGDEVDTKPKRKPRRDASKKRRGFFGKGSYVNDDDGIPMKKKGLGKKGR